MAERKRFRPEDLGPLPEERQAPLTCKIEEHKGFLIVVWRMTPTKIKSGFVSNDDLWNITRQ